MSLKIKTLSGASEALEEGVAFKVYGKPQGKDRPRFRNAGRFVQVYTPKETLEYERRIADAYLKAGGQKLDLPVMITVIQQFAVPKSATKADRKAMLELHLVPNCKPDIDNVLKAVLDGLNNVAYHDDTQVLAVVCERRYGEEAYLEVIVEGIDATMKRSGKND